MAEKDTARKIKKSDIVAIRWMFKICKKERFKILLLIVTNIVTAFLTIIYANFSKNIINAATIDKSFELVIRYAVYYLLIILFQLALTLLS